MDRTMLNKFLGYKNVLLGKHLNSTNENHVMNALVNCDDQELTNFFNNQYLSVNTPLKNGETIFTQAIKCALLCLDDPKRAYKDFNKNNTELKYVFNIITQKANAGQNIDQRKKKR